MKPGAHQRRGAALHRCPHCQRTGLQVGRGFVVKCCYCPYQAEFEEFVQTLPDGPLKREFEEELRDAQEAAGLKGADRI